MSYIKSALGAPTHYYHKPLRVSRSAFWRIFIHLVMRVWTETLQHKDPQRALHMLGYIRMCNHQCLEFNVAPLYN